MNRYYYKVTVIDDLLKAVKVVTRKVSCDESLILARPGVYFESYYGHVIEREESLLLIL